MKKLITIAASSALLSGFAVLPVISHAQLTADIRGNADLSVENSAVQFNNSLDMDRDASSQTQVDTSNEEVVEEEEANRPLRVNISGVAITSASQVDSAADLEVFSANAAIKESLVSKVDIDSTDDEKSEVKVVYQHKGKLFGFIPVTIESTTVVESKAEESEPEVRSKMAWWGLFVSGINHSRSDIESRVKNSVAVQANAKANANARANASVAEAVIAELQSHGRASATASAAVSAR